MDLYKVWKQGRDENTQKDYPTCTSVPFVHVIYYNETRLARNAG